MSFITNVGHEVFPNIWVIYCIAAFGWSTGQVGLTLALIGIVAAINQATMVGPIVAKFGERKVLLREFSDRRDRLGAHRDSQRLHVSRRRSNRFAADVSVDVASAHDAACQGDRTR